MKPFQWKSELLVQAGVLHGCTDASFGALRFGRVEPDEAVGKNRDAWLAAIGGERRTVFLSEQAHGARVLRIDGGMATGGFVQLGEGDALMTDAPEALIVVKTADCVPVLLFDPVRHTVAAVHSGWKGTALNIVAKTIDALGDEYGCKPKDMLAAIGPSICAKHYDVTDAKDGRVAAFEAQFGKNENIVVRTDSRISLDIAQACRMQCEQAGVPASQVDLSGVCTFEDERWPSYRREGAALRNDIWAYIALPRTK